MKLRVLCSLPGGGRVPADAGGEVGRPGQGVLAVRGSARAVRQGRPGQAVQVEPVTPPLKAPGTKRLKLTCEEPLSNFAFNINLRRYSLVHCDYNEFNILVNEEQDITAGACTRSLLSST